MEKSLISALHDFLAHPVIELQVTDSQKVKDMEGYIEHLQSECKRLEYAYAVECQYSLRYRDLLSAHGIKVN